jgi:hypothetical protein
MEVMNSSEALTLISLTWRHIPEDSILRNYRRKNLKPYISIIDYSKHPRVCVRISQYLADILSFVFITKENEIL